MAIQTMLSYISLFNHIEVLETVFEKSRYIIQEDGEIFLKMRYLSWVVIQL